MDYSPIVASIAPQFGVPTDLALGVMGAESGGNPLAVSPKGARGLFQLMPDTAKNMGVSNPFDPVQNATGGLRYLGGLMQKYGDPQTALTAYNWGPGNVDKFGADAAPPETKAYVAKVTGGTQADPFMQMLTGAKGDASAGDQNDPFLKMLSGTTEQAPAQAPATEQKQTPAAQPAPFTGSAPSGAIQGVNDLQNGAAQWLYNLMPQPIRDAGDAADHALYQATGGMIGTQPGMNFNQAVQSQNAAYEAGRAANGRSGIDVPRALGNAGGIAALSATGLPAAGVGGGVVAGSLAPVTNGGGDYWADKGKDMAIGGALGGVTNAAANFLGNVVAPKVSDAVRSLTDSGVTLTPGQIFGGSLKRIEDAATSIPFLGDMVKNAQRRSFVDLNTAAINRSLSPLGEQLPSNMTGRNAIAYAGQRLGDAYDDILSKMGAIRPDAQFTNDLGSLTALTQNLPKSTADQFQSIVKNEILGRIDSNGVMTPQAMKSAESNLGQMASGYLKNADYDTRQLGSALQEAQATLRSMVQRVAPPQYTQALQAVNNGWANFLRVQRAASMTGSDNGVFTPAQLQNSVKALDQSRNKGAFARGGALMQDLSDNAKSVMGNTVPDSGTPMRHAVELGLGAVAGHSILPESVMGAAIPAAAVGAGAALPYTKAGQAITASLLAGKRPAAVQQVGDLIRRGLPWAAPALTSGLLSAPQSGQ